MPITKFLQVQRKSKFLYESSAKKRPVFRNQISYNKSYIGSFIKFAHCIGSKPGGLKNWPFWDYWEIVDFFGIKKPKTLDFTRVFGYRRNIAK